MLHAFEKVKGQKNDYSISIDGETEFYKLSAQHGQCMGSTTRLLLHMLLN